MTGSGFVPLPPSDGALGTLDERFPGTRHTLQVQLSEYHGALAAARTEVEQLRARAERADREASDPVAWRGMEILLEEERALADRLAEALETWKGRLSDNDPTFGRHRGEAALAEWWAARALAEPSETEET